MYAEIEGVCRDGVSWDEAGNHALLPEMGASSDLYTSTIHVIGASWVPV